MSTHWLARFPVALFAIPYGMFGLAAAWRRAAALGWNIAAGMSQAILWPTLALWTVLLILYGGKCLRYPALVLQECSHPVQGALSALIPLSILLVVINLGQPGSWLWLTLVLLALVVQGAIVARSTYLIVTGQLPASQATPALYLPSVGGGLIGGICLATLHYPGWSALLFGMGIAGWALLEMRVLNHLYRTPMAPALRPTIGVELAPACVATLAAAVIWPELPASALNVGLGIAMGPALTVLLRYRWWYQEPFALGFWSFSFPLAALASAVLEVVRRGGFPPLIGSLALLLASLVIAFLLIRTAILLFKGKLIPAPA